MRGVELDDGTIVEAPIVVSACDPHATFLSWLRNPPASARALVDRWRAIPRHDGYESKVDAVISELPAYHQLDPTLPDRLGFDPLHATAIVAPPVDAMHAAHRLMAEGRVADRADVLRQRPVRPRSDACRSEGGWEGGRAAGTSSASRCSSRPTPWPEVGPPARSPSAG